jgi:hypothetical protein
MISPHKEKVLGLLRAGVLGLYAPRQPFCL